MSELFLRSPANWRLRYLEKFQQQAIRVAVTLTGTSIQRQHF
jgi:hypothetical protein